jgi:hypothetical protein
MFVEFPLLSPAEDAQGDCEGGDEPSEQNGNDGVRVFGGRGLSAASPR